MARRNMLPFSPEEKRSVDHDAAMAVYLTATPFSTLRNSYFNKFLHRLDPSYTAPSRDQLSGILLDEAYNPVATEVNNVLQRQQYLHIIMDESDDISGNRIMNMCILISYGAFHHCTRDSGSMRHTAENLANWALSEIGQVVGSDWRRVTSYISDTCATMRNVWRILELDPRMAPVLFVPCDSHGLQLLIKDILSVEPHKSVLAECQAIANAFKSSHLQYQYLTEHQRQVYGKRKAFILSVITRWGTQAGLISSVLDNCDAIRAYLMDPRQKVSSNRVQTSMCDPHFWLRLSELNELIHFIHEQQKMSESEKTHLGHVHCRWLAVRNHITRLIPLQPTVSQLLPILETRRKTQFTPLHTTAYYLDPKNVNAPSMFAENPIEEFSEMLRFIGKYAGETGKIQFAEFRIKHGVFARFDEAWKHVDRSIMFWGLMSSFVPELGSLAVKIFKTPPNSVPSERSFSTHKLFHDKRRNKLCADKFNKMVYIHVNQRVLDRDYMRGGWINASEEELVALEDDFVMSVAEGHSAYGAGQI